MQLEQILSTRTAHMEASAIREILKVIGQPGMISLAGGLPAPESFPMDVIQRLTNDVFTEFGAQALQYGTTEGFAPLREALLPYLREKGIDTRLENLCIFSGSQSVLDAIGKVVISPGDRVVMEAPSYLGAISAFNPYEPTYVSVPTDCYGVIPEALEDILAHDDIKLVYLVPTFHNPTGRTITLERRQKIAELAQKYDVLLLEDDPYSALRYSGDALPPIHHFAPEHTIYTSTFSKILAPGLRLGFVVAPPQLLRWLVIAKQGIDLHTQTFGQAIAALYLGGGYLQAHLPNIIDLYRPRRDAMLNALDQSMPRHFKWSKPEGGMFVWVEGPTGFDSEAFYWQMVEKKVAFVPGKFFYATDVPGMEATMRLNFTMVDEEHINRAIHILAQEAEETLALA